MNRSKIREVPVLWLHNACSGERMTMGPTLDVGTNGLSSAYETATCDPESRISNTLHRAWLKSREHRARTIDKCHGSFVYTIRQVTAGVAKAAIFGGVGLFRLGLARVAILITSLAILAAPHPLASAAPNWGDPPVPYLMASSVPAHSARCRSCLGRLREATPPAVC